SLVIPGLLDGPEDRRLVEHAHPLDWSEPFPASRYDLVVLGGGPAGLVSAVGGALLGAKVALCERGLLGGDCLAYGCVPSKALIRSAQASAEARSAGRRGIHLERVSVNGAEVMRRLRRIRAKVAAHDAASRIRDLGIDVFLREARFVARDAVEVGGKRLRFVRAILAAGSRARVPDIPGLAEAGYVTHVEAFALTEVPRRMAIIGAGPVGCELGQAFARLGSEVTLLESGGRILLHDDPEAAGCVARALKAELRLELDVAVIGTEREGEVRRLQVTRGAERFSVDADLILVASGREPSLERLGLDSAGIEAAGTGVKTDARLRTSNSRVWAAGDVTGRWAFTHASDAMARLVLRNALFFGRQRVEDLVMPWCTFTEPELAQVGIGAERAREEDAITLTQPFEENDRAIVDETTEGFARVHLARNGRVLGATCVGARAGELISEMSLAIQERLTMGAVGRTIHPYPTRSEVWRRLADDWLQRRVTPPIAAMLRKVIALRRL
ncbi:MAG TPA: FAD-dependent oxidoreductase, partial [Myxococcaceae bacterium]